MSKSITVNTGEKIEVRNTDGELMGFFYFNPADPDLMRRSNEAYSKLTEILDKISDKPSTEEVETVNGEIRQQMAHILGESAADTLFLYNSPLAVMPDGTVYALYVFDIVCEFIQSEVNARVDKMQAQVDKYTAKYNK